MLKIVLLGGGNVAQHLLEVFSKTPTTTVVQCYNRNLSTIENFQKHTEITNNLEQLKPADVYIIAIKDDAIADFSRSLPLTNKLVVHTSGNVPMLTLADKNRRGVFYPLQSFSKEKEVNFSKIPICIEAENEADLKTLQTLAEAISQHVYTITSEQRKTLHVGAVFVNNFVNQLYQIGSEICEENKIPFEILQPLISETSEKIKTLTPLEAQTGPAKREDTATINSHLKLLKNEDFKDIYKLITKVIIKTHGREKL
ncbi:Rossmann-like and DUF2520 domain-containing protein [Joostella sp. CR20]|uniref:Rossmann-like and DUF2520 domain-containing protein n=1 Tax=Joostella sp. CR20 TaxID=2804312 RepID=UPI00313BDB71